MTTGVDFPEIGGTGQAVQPGGIGPPGPERADPGGGGGDDGARLAAFVRALSRNFTVIANDLDVLLEVPEEWALEARQVWQQLENVIPEAVSYLASENEDTDQRNLAQHGLAGISLNSKLAGFERAQTFWQRHRNHDQPDARRTGVRQLIRWSKSILDSLIEVVKTNTYVRAILEAVGEGVDLIGNMILDAEDERHVAGL